MSNKPLINEKKNRLNLIKKVIKDKCNLKTIKRDYGIVFSREASMLMLDNFKRTISLSIRCNNINGVRNKD
jgi:hypothetical protein